MSSPINVVRRFRHPLAQVRRQKLRVQKSLRRRGTRLGLGEISEALQAFGPCEAAVLMVHSSLSACGQITGGEKTVIDALRSWSKLTTLAMPTHSYCYPDDGEPPCFDPATSPSVVGTITDCFWRQPGVIRSLHPTHSLACEGPLARELCEGHDRTLSPCGKGTPYEKLLQRKSSVLMFGATLNAYTLFHTAEDAATVPYLYERERCELALRDDNGIKWRFSMMRQDVKVTRRFAEMDTWLEQRGLLVRRKLGLGELLYLPAAGNVHQVIVEELYRDPWFLVAESARPKAAGPSRVEISNHSLA